MTSKRIPTKTFFWLCLISLLWLGPTSMMRSSSRAQTLQDKDQSAGRGTGQVVSLGQIETRQGTITPHPPVRSPIFSAPPKFSPEQIQELEKSTHMPHLPYVVPTDPSVDPATIRPASPETKTTLVPTAPGEKPGNKPAVPAAPGTFSVFRNQIVSATTGAPNFGAPSEPTLGVNGRVIFWTGNTFAQVSGNKGQTWSFINPFDNFPADGVNDVVNGAGLCCDQVTYYDRTRGAMFWLLQYNAGPTTNTYRIAVARNQSEALNNIWGWYDFTPADCGLTLPNPPPIAGQTGYWLDFPDLAVSNNFLYFTANVFPLIPNSAMGACPGIHPSCGSGSAVIVRIPLNEISQGQPINFNAALIPRAGLRLTEGAISTMWFGAQNTNTQIRIYRWAENSGLIIGDTVDIDAYIAAPAALPRMNAPSPDGTDFAQFSDNRLQGAWVANGLIGFMWNVGEGGNFPLPHVEVARFFESNRIKASQGQVWGSTTAFLYPSVHPNDRGHLGGTIALRTANSFPDMAVWIADDFSATITPLENLTVTTATNGPGGNRWGDYFATRRDSPYGNTWHGSGYIQNGGTGTNNLEFREFWFGRERDTPPPTNTIYVDLANTSRYEDGSAAHPYNTVTEGHLAAQPGDTIIIRTGTYLETVRLNTQTTVRSEGGTATIRIP